MSPRNPVEFTNDKGQRVGNLVVLGTVASGGDSGQVLLVDEITGALTTISTPHHEVHEKSTFRFWFLQPHGSPLANDAEINITFTTTTKYPHFVFRAGIGGDCEIYLYRTPNFDLDGTVFTPHNLSDPLGSKISTVGVRINPTINGDGTEILAEFVPGGSGGNAAGNAFRLNTEDILRPDTSYLLKLINRAGNAKQFSIAGQWYEESDN